MGTRPSNTTAVCYVDGAAMARRAALVVCNSGSPTTHQAQAEGCPVLAVPTNLDQYLNMEGVQAAGAGQVLRTHRLKPQYVRETAARMLVHPRWRVAADGLRDQLARYDARARFVALMDGLRTAGTAPSGSR